MRMAFLSSFRIGQQTVYPEELHERLKTFALLDNVGDAALRNLLSEANWFALPGGMLLERDGENNAALFLVVTGSLGVFVENEQGERQMVAHVPAGETVGEMSLIAGSSNHNAQLVALRDTELLAHLARRLRGADRPPSAGDDESDANSGAPAQGCQSRPQPQIPAQDLRHRAAAGGACPMCRSPSAWPRRWAPWACARRCWMPRPSDQTAEWFNTFEQAHDVVFYRGDAPDSPWTHLCLRQADRIFLLARANRPLPLAPLDLPAFKARASGLPELLLLHPDGASAVLPEHFSLRGGLFANHHHLRAGHQADVARVARFIAGRAVGLVLAGGGARGFAHIGIIKALKEAGVPFDQLGGTSMGAIIAAGLAREWALEEMTDADAGGVRGRQSAFGLHPAADRAGARARRSARGCASISTRWRSRNCRCLSSRCRPISPPAASISIAKANCGGRCAPRVALPGILPPVTHHGHLLVDGGVMNNLPVDVMREQAGGDGPHHRLRRHRRDRSAGPGQPLWRAALVVAAGPAHARHRPASSPS